MIRLLRTLLPVLVPGFLLAGCVGVSPRPTQVSGPVPAARAPSGPTIDIAAAPERVRQVVAARARARGTAVVENSALGVVLERQLAQTPPVLEEACGPHRPGRIVRVTLSTSGDSAGTRLVEERFIVDGRDVCPVPLTDSDIEEAGRGLAEIKAEAERVARR